MMTDLMVVGAVALVIVGLALMAKRLLSKPENQHSEKIYFDIRPPSDTD